MARSIIGIIFSGFNPEMDQHMGTVQPPFVMPPAGPYRLRTHLARHGYDIEIIEYMSVFTDDELLKLIDDRYDANLRFIGFSVTFNQTSNRVLMENIRIRWPDLKIIVGAPEPRRSVFIEDAAVANSIDMLFYGYAENSLLEYCRFLSGQRSDFPSATLDNGSKYVISDTTLPYLDYHDLSIEWQADDPVRLVKAIPMEISRGCIFKCKFCRFPMIGKKKYDYVRSPSNMADEFRRNWEKFGLRHYLFADDTLNDTNQKLDDIAEAMRLSAVDVTFSAHIRYDLLHANPEMIDKLCDLGLHTAVLGIESFHEPSRKIAGKGLTNDQILDILGRFKKVKPNVFVNNNFIIGLPGESIEHIRQTAEWLVKQDHAFIDGWHWNSLTISKQEHLTSEFERNPEKYGYSVDEMQHWWSNSEMTSIEARILATELNAVRDRFSRYHSFINTDLLALGFDITDDIFTLPIDQKDTSTRKLAITNAYKDLKLRNSS